MTTIEQAYAALNQTQDDFTLIARELDHARNAVKRSKSKANVARFIAAEDAFDAGLEICDAAYAVVDAAREAEEDAAAVAEALALAAEQPSFAF